MHLVYPDNLSNKAAYNYGVYSVLAMYQETTAVHISKM